MYEQPVLVVMIVGIAADMRSAIANQDAFVELARQALGNDGACEPGSGNQVIEHVSVGHQSPSAAGRTVAAWIAVTLATVSFSPRRLAIARYIRCQVRSQEFCESALSTRSRQS